MYHTITLASEKYLQDKLASERIAHRHHRNVEAIQMLGVFLVGLATIYVSAYFAYGVPKLVQWYTSF